MRWIGAYCERLGEDWAEEASKALAREFDAAVAEAALDKAHHGEGQPLRVRHRKSDWAGWFCSRSDSENWP
jgi:hypothetical protein